MDYYGFVLAGGDGTRFWPLSRRRKPKQLINLSGCELMLNEAIDRVATVIDKNNIFIMTSEMQAAAVMEATAGRVFQNNIIIEPEAKNTAACIGYAATRICKTHGDGIMVITPADHYVKESRNLTLAFRRAIKEAEKQDKLVTIGIKPSSPATGYGYIRTSFNDRGIGDVTEFKEKPNKETAEKYLSSGEYLWNSGMFIWKASVILEKYKKYAQDIFEGLEIIGSAINTHKEQTVLHDIYPQFRKTSIDYTILEPSAANNEVLVITEDFGWNDIGSWDAMETLHPCDGNGNVLLGDVVAVDVKNSVIYSNSRTVAAVGVQNLVIVETGDVIMICSKDNCQDVKKLVAELETGHRSLL